jgi:type IV pilus assembly protein PilE
MKPSGAISDFAPGRRERGFTLIELMIAVVVVGILSAIAFPSFMDSIRKSRRSEAFTALNNVQQAQERFRGNNATYADSLTGSPTDSTPSARGLGLSTPTPGGYYSISLSNVTATGYEAIATAVSGTSQANDGDCAKLGVRLAGGNIQYAAASGGSLSWGGANRCWNR